MSIILEALKKASVNKNVPASNTATVTIRPRKESFEAQKIEIPQRNSFNLSRIALIASAAIVAVCVVVFLMSNVGRETRVSQYAGTKAKAPVGNKTTAASASLTPTSVAKTDTVGEGYLPPQALAVVAPKQEVSAVNSFITKLSNPRLTLNGIIYGIGKPTAIIENKILEEGADIKGAKVVKINSDSVEMLNEVTGETFVLKWE